MATRWTRLLHGTPLTVYTIRERGGSNYWIRLGSAFVNKDGSLNVLLDALPLDDKLHIREDSGQDGQSADATEGPNIDTSVRYSAFLIPEGSGGQPWERAGIAFTNRDGSLKVHLDRTPKCGRLQLRRLDPMHGSAPAHVHAA